MHTYYADIKPAVKKEYTFRYIFQGFLLTIALGPMANNTPQPVHKTVSLQLAKDTVKATF